MEKKFSVVIPVYNEEESLFELTEQVRKALHVFKKPYEIIFVDDGSSDRTFEILRILEKKYREVKVYSFRKNLGKSYALLLGFKKAEGEFIATLDSDLQDDPRNIKALYRKLTKGGYDVVTGWRKDRKDDFSKVAASKMFNKIVSALFDLKINDLNSGLKLYKSQVAKDLKLYGGLHRFIPIIAKEMGYKVTEVEVLHRVRKYGQSKYKLTKIITDIPDLVTIYFLTKYTRRPLHFFGRIGSSVLLIGILILIYLSTLHFLGQSIGRRPLFLLGILLVIAGIQTIFTGLLADLIVNVNHTEYSDFPIKYETKN